MYSFLKETHSGFRYIVIILLIAALVSAFSGWLGNKNFTKNNKRIYLFTLISAHIQLLIGLLLYFVSDITRAGMSNFAGAMKSDALRYWTVEHWVMMLIAIVLITVGYSRSKKAENNTDKHRNVAIFYTIALLVIIIAIVQSGRGLLTMTH